MKPRTATLEITGLEGEPTPDTFDAVEVALQRLHFTLYRCLTNERKDLAQNPRFIVQTGSHTDLQRIVECFKNELQDNMRVELLFKKEEPAENQV